MKKIILALALIVAGCSRSSGPKPMTVEEIPGALSNAFKTARLLTKQNAMGIAKQVQEKQYVPATIQLQALLPQELNDQQREVASAALQTLNGVLAEQAATLQPEAAVATEGSPKPPKIEVSKEEAAAAEEVRRQYMRTK
jgi:hypothetical protein